MGAVSIRLFEQSDALEVSRLVLRVIRNEFSNNYSKDVIRVQSARYSSEGILASKAIRWVAVARGRIVGTVGADGPEIVGLFVEKEERNCGVGSALLRTAEKTVFKEYPQTIIYAAHGSEEFDLKHGYSPIKRIRISCKGVRFWVTYLVKNRPQVMPSRTGLSP